MDSRKTLIELYVKLEAKVRARYWAQTGEELKVLNAEIKAIDAEIAKLEAETGLEFEDVEVEIDAWIAYFG